MIIKKGDKFKCIRDVIMDDDPKSIAYTSDKIYISEVDECITDNQGLVYHHWNNKEDNQDFIKLSEKQQKCLLKENKIRTVFQDRTPGQDLYHSLSDNQTLLWFRFPLQAP